VTRFEGRGRKRDSVDPCLLWWWCFFCIILAFGGRSSFRCWWQVLAVDVLLCETVKGTMVVSTAALTGLVGRLAFVDVGLVDSLQYVPVVGPTLTLGVNLAVS